MQDKSIFDLQNIGYRYSSFEEYVLHDISLNINKGEKICILGANGAGKSTLLRILAGILSPTGGKFIAFGQEINEDTLNQQDIMQNYHRKVGFVFQNSDIQLFCNTVSDEIAFGPLQLCWQENDVLKNVDEMLKLFHIEHLKDKTPYKLSGGEKKKVAFAATFALNPDVLLLDEPTNGLDPKTSRFLIKFLQEQNHQGKTIITSTHNLELVSEISDRVIIFDESHKIVCDGSTADVMRNTELLQRVNLVDSHYHSHGEGNHLHFHMHDLSDTD